MCPNPINFGSSILSFFLLFVFFLLLLLRLVVNWLWWSFWNVRLAVSRVKWVNLLVCLCMDSAYGDKYRLETWRYSIFFFISAPPVVRIIATQSLFFCFLMPYSIQFGIRVVCMCVRESVCARHPSISSTQENLLLLASTNRWNAIRFNPTDLTTIELFYTRGT